jgi:hypothetical protein
MRQLEDSPRSNDGSEVFREEFLHSIAENQGPRQLSPHRESKQKAQPQLAHAPTANPSTGYEWRILLS